MPAPDRELQDFRALVTGGTKGIGHAVAARLRESGADGASKGAINALTRSIATQYGRQGIRAVGVSPGVIVTEGARESVPAETLARLNKHNLASSAISA